MQQFVLVKVFGLCVEDVEIHNSMPEAQKAFEKFTGVNYEYFQANKQELFERDWDYEQTNIFAVNNNLSEGEEND